jgi:hypothetical protein
VQLAALHAFGIAMDRAGLSTIIGSHNQDYKAEKMSCGTPATEAIPTLRGLTAKAPRRYGSFIK